MEKEDFFALKGAGGGQISEKPSKTLNFVKRDFALLIMFLTEVLKRMKYLCLSLTLQINRCTPYPELSRLAVREQTMSGLRDILKTWDFI